MGFEAQQVRKLRAKLKPKFVRSRIVEGTELHYLEGWHVIAEANRIFGFDGWDRETVESKCVWTKQNGSRFSAAYVTRVRITVKAGDSSIVREGSGAGEAHEATPGMAHDRAAKAAETDATKRALMTFGNAFGLSLYGDPPATNKRARGQMTGSRKSEGPACEPASAPPEVAEDSSVEPDSRAASPSADQHSLNNARPSTEKNVPETRQPAADVSPQEVPACPAAQATVKTFAPSLQPWPDIDPFEEAARRAEARGKIDKSQLALSEPRRERDPDHLKRVASRPCLVCGRNRAQAHHLTYLQPRAMGRKVSDEFTVPLCATHHRNLHASGNERGWWQVQGVDPEPAAKALWRDSHQAAPQPNPDQVPTQEITTAEN